MNDAPIDPRLLDVAHRRLRNGGLWGKPFPDPKAVVSWFGAVQGQDYEPAKWSLASRCGTVNHADIDKLIDEGQILRTHALRPTWHLVTPEDIRWVQALTAPRVHIANTSAYRNFGVDELLRSRTQDLLQRWLEEEAALTRPEVAARLRAVGIEADGPRLAHILMNAELEAVICNGPRRGKQHTYALVSQRAPQAVTLDREDALAELTWRYFSSHGPATVDDFRWWSSLTVAEIRRGLDLVGDRLSSREVAGMQFWSTDRSPFTRPRGPTVQLLQQLDEYLVGYRASRHVADLGGLLKTMPEGRAFAMWLMFVDGQVAGEWQRAIDTDRVEVDMILGRPLTTAERSAVEAGLASYGRFHDRTATINYSEVTAGPSTR